MRQTGFVHQTRIYGMKLNKLLRFLQNKVSFIKSDGYAPILREDTPG